MEHFALEARRLGHAAILLSRTAAKFWDAVVTGSGIGSATLALKLAQAGRRILVEERGDFLKFPLEPSGSVGRYLYHVVKGSCVPLAFVCGQSKFYSAALYRLRDHDFQATEHECGASPAWPITYADFEPTKTVTINTYNNGRFYWPYPLGIIQLGGRMPFWECVRSAMRFAAEFVSPRSFFCFYPTEALPGDQTGFIFEGAHVAQKNDPLHNLPTFAKLREIATHIFRRAGYQVVVRIGPPYLWYQVGQRAWITIQTTP